MNCEGFHAWLENRDLSDLSESDRAIKHAGNCASCDDLLKKDELLERVIARGLAREALPEHLEKIVTLNLGGAASGRMGRSAGITRMLSVLVGVCVLLTTFYLLPTDYSARDDFGTALIKHHGVHSDGQNFEKIDNLTDWLSAHSGFQASVPESFAGRGLELIGARICTIDKCQTVHLVYRDTTHLVSLYIIDEKQVPAPLDEGRTYTVALQGHNVKMWRQSHQVYAVVS